jgi:hypothetical protein
MSTQGPKDSKANDTIEVALLSAKDKTAVTVQIYSANEDPLTYAEIADILFELADQVADTKGAFLEEDGEDIHYC